MSASPASAVAQSQKRPLEEPSSPGAGDQPEAKRPALDKIIKSDEQVETHVTEETAIAVAGSAPEDDASAVLDADLNGNGASHADTVLPDAPVTAAGLDDDAQDPSDILQPIQSTASGQAVLSQPVTHQQNEATWLHVRSVISSQEAATVIGKGGENVTIIRNRSGAKCTVSDYARGAVERILTVSGPVDAVSKAFGLIIRTLNQEDLDAPSNAQSKTYPLRLLIPHILIGSVIGKGGARIKEIQNASGARLNASESCLPLSTERSLVVLGVADAVHIATYYICKTLIDQLTERFGGPAASAYATRSGHPAGAVPGGMQVVPYIPQNAAGQWGHPTQFQKHNNSAQRTPANPYGVAYLHGQPPQPQQPAAQQPMHYGAQQGAYAGPAAHQQRAQPYPAAQHPGPAPHAGAAQPPMAGGMPGQAITQQIFIPNDMVGAIIGKGGAKINEIRQLSGSVIKINEPSEGSNERLVTITGTQECNQMALYMLYSRLENEKHRI